MKTMRATSSQPVITTQRSFALKRRIGVLSPDLNGLSAKNSAPNFPVMPSDPPKVELKVAERAIWRTISAAAMVTIAR
jgi:hypothetical protein